MQTKKLGIIAFIVVLWIPIVAQLLNFSFLEDTEKRQRAEFPQLSFSAQEVTNFPTKYDDYYKDNFGLRTEFVTLNSLLNYFLFIDAPNESITRGREGWLFTSEVVGDQQSEYIFTDDDYEKWSDMFTTRAEYLHERNIDYFVLITPDKHRVFPDYYPNIGKNNQTPEVEKLVEYLKTESAENYEVIYPLPELREARDKSEYPLFYRYDTHWTPYGAYWGYRPLIESINHTTDWQIPVVELTKLEVDTSPGRKSDLSQSGSLACCLRERRITFSFPEGLVGKSATPPSYVTDYVDERDVLFYQKNDGENLPRVLLYRDSFALYMLPLLTSGTSEILIVRDRQFDFHPDLIEQFKPDVVVRQRVERTVNELTEMGGLDYRALD
jgi:hypothetical protein